MTGPKHKGPTPLERGGPKKNSKFLTGQTVVEYLMLFAIVAAVSLLCVSAFYNKSWEAANLFFYKSASAIMGEPGGGLFCGDGICGAGETASNCFVDCHCGDGICGAGETASNCFVDCHCGNGICDEKLKFSPVNLCLPDLKGEDASNCSSDCSNLDGVWVSTHAPTMMAKNYCYGYCQNLIGCSTDQCVNCGTDHWTGKPCKKGTTCQGCYAVLLGGTPASDFRSDFVCQ